MERRPTWRWLVTRFELAIAGICALVPVSIIACAPHFSGGIASSVMGVELRDALLIGGQLAMLVGLTWMVRIARGPEDGRPSIWRYRQR
jgi:hypothetical protein